MNDRVDAHTISRFRNFLMGQGFIDISIRPGREFGKFVCTAYDPQYCKVFSRVYDLPEMQCITYSNKIFWRYFR